MSPISKDYLGEVIATAYLLFLGLLFSGLVAVFAPRDVSPLGLFQVGFALYFVAIATVNKTTFDLSALAVTIGGLAINDYGLKIVTGMTTEQWWGMLLIAHGMPVAIVTMITHYRDGIFKRSPIF